MGVGVKELSLFVRNSVTTWAGCWTNMSPLEHRPAQDFGAFILRRRGIQMNDLVQRLSAGRHPIEVGLRPHRTVNALKEGMDRGYVHIRFTDTRGGTELGFSVDRGRTDVSEADFNGETGRLTLVGELTLDYVRVRCVARIELPSLRGEGWLERPTETVADRPIDTCESR